MKRATILCITMLMVIGVGLPAQATINPSYRDITDGGCVLNMSTAACFGFSSPASVFQAPTVTQCTARESQNQRCRHCLQAYFDDGTPRGYLVCAYVAYDAGCDCKNPQTLNCQNTGSCVYSRN